MYQVGKSAVAEDGNNEGHRIPLNTLSVLASCGDQLVREDTETELLSNRVKTEQDMDHSCPPAERKEEEGSVRTAVTPSCEENPLSEPQKHEMISNFTLHVFTALFSQLHSNIVA